MKRTLILLLALALLLALSACAGMIIPAAGQSDTSETPANAAEPTSAPEAAADAAAPTDVPPTAEKALHFSTTALDGTAADESILEGHALTMINFFEPWCPPCVAELPELERLYETYAPEGFQILGVFSSEEGVEKVLAEASVSYPILRYTQAFDAFQTGYVPTTVFVNERGELVGQTQIGANSYEGWETIIKELLG